MDYPGNGIYIVQGEMSLILTGMRKANRWSGHSHQDEETDILVRSFNDLKDVLNQIGDLRELDPNHFLGPFLEVIKSEDTTGPVTSLALSSIYKFISYRLIDPNGKSIAATVDNIADAVTHARFLGTDQNSDSVVLLKILQVLRAVMLSPIGVSLTNECVCEIMQSCFRICFEPRFPELLRKCADGCLRDIVQLLFASLPKFSDNSKKSYNIKKLKMRTGSIDSGRGKKKSKLSNWNRKKSDDNVSPAEKPVEQPSIQSPVTTCPQIEAEGQEQVVCDKDSKSHTESFISDHKDVSATSEDDSAKPEGSSTMENVPSANALPTAADQSTPDDPVMACVQDPSAGQEEPCKQIVEGVVISIEDTNSQEGDPQEEDPLLNPQMEHASDEGGQDQPIPSSEIIVQSEPLIQPPYVQLESPSTEYFQNDTTDTKGEIYLNSPIEDNGAQDWVNQQGVRFTSEDQESSGVLLPYGLVCVHELLRFLVSLCNPMDKQNTEPMIHTGLNLITIALEVGADYMARFPSLLNIVKDDLSRNLFSLLNSERLPIFATVLQVSFLLFESLRTHLKFQLEMYLTRLTEIIVSDSIKITYEQKEIALESVVQMWRIPGLVTELYLNYDCDLYCPNLYEELTKLLSKNAFPMAGVHNTHLLSLDALLTVIDSIESHCNNRIMNERQQSLKDNKASELGSTGDPPELSKNYIVRNGTRQKISVNIPSHEQLMAIKRKKKLLSTGTEQFNTKPKRGIQFLQEHNLLSTPLDPQEVVDFLRENPHLDKKMIGEYISNRANLPVLDSFVKSFDFTETRIDEALRLYLESFRLPGESPLISLVMEHFADHWHKCNGEPFANADAAFTLAYAIIMLNVDQHNHNVKKQNIPMKADDFKRNLKNVNGGINFEEEMLDDIYSSIKNEEIVMPAEQTGIVKENYLWKVLLRRGASKDGIYVHAPNGLLDHDLFSLIWSPTVAALSFLFDKTADPAIYQKAISGFRKCAMISAHYGMTNDFDNLIISLCKFTLLHNSQEVPDQLTITFGANPKGRLAAKTVFNLARRHGDIIRESWRNILDCIWQLYRCKLLPNILVEAEDFIELSGKISLVREEIQLSPKTETGLFSSLYSYISLAAETNTQKGPSPEDKEAIRLAQNCIRECQLEQLVTESKFLRLDSLQHFIKALIKASYGPEGHVSLGSSHSEDTAVFFLEFLLKVVMQNRDRITLMWSSIRVHIYTLLMGAAACDHHFLVERSVVGLLRLAIRLMRREDMSPMVLQSLRMLLLLKGSTLARVSRHVSSGMYELLKTSAANIHSATDWAIIFTLLECVGAGAPPPRVVGKPPNSDSGGKRLFRDSGARSEGETCVDSGLGNERGYTSDSELSKAGSKPLSPASSPEVPLNTQNGWILVGPEGEIQPVTYGGRVPPPDYSLIEKELSCHDPFSMVKCCESLAFLIRDVAHITPYNFENCIHCIRTFVEAIAETNERKCAKKNSDASSHRETRKKVSKKKVERARSPTGYDADESDPEEVPSGYQQICIQLLDLMFTLHTRTAQIFKWWAEETTETEYVSLWSHAWCPLLQGISRLCSHPNRQVRMSAITYLQRALLVPDLQSLNGAEWESCFTQVLFPLLNRLLDPITPQSGLEETRMRAATVLSKVFLHHLTPLQSLPSFIQLWMTILDFMDKYMHVDNGDLLYEAIPESLKNMLLVMDSANVFVGLDGRNEIWVVTWDRINSFLPNLQSELFRAHPSVEPNAGEAGQEGKEQSEVTEEPPTHGQLTLEEPSVPQILPPQSIVMNPSIRPGEVVEVSSSHLSQPSSGPHNWHPPAPLFPNMGQIVSTPIGPSSQQVQMPVYSGFAALPQQPPSPSAQFFYQDMPKDASQAASSPTQGPGVSPLLLTSGLLEGSPIPPLPVISPPTSS